MTVAALADAAVVVNNATKLSPPLTHFTLLLLVCATAKVSVHFLCCRFQLSSNLSATTFMKSIKNSADKLYVVRVGKLKLCCWQLAS